MLLRSTRTSHRRDQSGQALVVVTLLMVSLLGMAALVIDVGRVLMTRRQLQNAADAAALAGAWWLPAKPTTAMSDADAWAHRNGVKDEGGITTLSVTENRVFQTRMPNDTITVTTSRQRDYLFAQVLGLGRTTATATATAQLFTINGLDTSNGRFFPYAVWGGNIPRNIGVGTRVTYRSNQYDSRNVKPTPGCPTKNKLKNCNWDINSNTFKGYFHWKSGSTVIYIKPGVQPVESQGGNAFGTSELNALIANQKAGMPVILPVIDRASDANSNLGLRIIAFVCVLLDPIDKSGSSDWTGVITDRCVTNGHRDGDTQPPTDLPVAYVPILIE